MNVLESIYKSFFPYVVAYLTVLIMLEVIKVLSLFYIVGSKRVTSPWLIFLSSRSPLLPLLGWMVPSFYDTCVSFEPHPSQLLTSWVVEGKMVLI